MVNTFSREAVAFFEGYKYNFTSGPLIDYCPEPHEGVNCQLVAYALLEELFGIGLPKWLLSKELFFDNTYTCQVTDPAKSLTALEYWADGLEKFLLENHTVQLGDIFIFTWFDDRKSPEYYHLALVTEVTELDIMLTHSVQFEDVTLDTVVTWSLTNMLTRQSGRYAKLLCIKRPLV